MTKDIDSTTESTAAILEHLFEVIKSRQGGNSEASYTAKLLAHGTPKVAQKVGEEAVEVIIEAMKGDGGKLAEESADLLYHLLVLWADKGVRPDEVWSVLEERFGISGIEEKNSREKY